MNEVFCSFLVDFFVGCTVFFPRTVSPTILEDPVSVSVFAPTPLTLTCTAEGYPRPTIIWTKTSPNGEVAEFSLLRDIFNLTETANINGLNVTSSLTILDTIELNTGNWSCRAANNFGDAISHPAEVVIYCKPYKQLLVGVIIYLHGL